MDANEHPYMPNNLNNNPCRKFASINFMTRWNAQGVFAIPKDNTINL